MKKGLFVGIGCGVALLAGSVNAADWSDTSISWRYGTKYAEPYNTNDISKHILALTHVSGYKYGTNFLNVDMLMSNNKDSTDPGVKSGAQEVYVVYRHTLDIGKAMGEPIKFGPVRGVGATVGFDLNTKSGDGYDSKKRMWVIGPTLMVDVPGFLDVSVLELWESNRPTFIDKRYSYKAHPMLTAAWGIPFSLGSVGLGFEGFMNYIAAKGANEVGGATSPETNIDMEVMADIGALMGTPKNTLRAGLEYQYWHNKFGNPSDVPGSTARTPMVRVEYHF